VTYHRALGWTLAFVALGGRWLVAHGGHEDVRQAEQARASALRDGSVDVLEPLLADAYTDVDVHGRLRGRTEALSIDPDSSTTEPVTVSRQGTVAIVVGREHDARVMRVWIFADSTWRLVAQQAVPILPGAPEVDPLPAVLAQPRLIRAVDDPIVRDVLRAQDTLDRANATGDPATFAELTAPNFVLVTAHGLIRTKADRVIEERIRRLEDRPSRPLPGRDDEHIRRYGPVAVITARTWPRAADGHARAPSRFTRVWVEQSGAWQQLANITTPLAP